MVKSKFCAKLPTLKINPLSLRNFLLARILKKQKLQFRFSKTKIIRQIRVHKVGNYSINQTVSILKWQNMPKSKISSMKTISFSIFFLFALICSQFAFGQDSYVISKIETENEYADLEKSTTVLEDSSHSLNLER